MLFWTLADVGHFSTSREVATRDTSSRLDGPDCCGNGAWRPCSRRMGRRDRNDRASRGPRPYPLVRNACQPRGCDACQRSSPASSTSASCARLSPRDHGTCRSTLQRQSWQPLCCLCSTPSLQAGYSPFGQASRSRPSSLATPKTRHSTTLPWRHLGGSWRWCTQSSGGPRCSLRCRCTRPGWRRSGSSRCATCSPRRSGRWRRPWTSATRIPRSTASG